MATTIIEYSGFAVGTNRGANPQVPQEPALAVTVISSGGSSGTPQTIQFSSATNLIEIVSPTANFFGAFGSSLFSSTSGSTISSTSAVPFPAGGRFMRGVRPSSKLLAFST